MLTEAGGGFGGTEIHAGLFLWSHVRTLSLRTALTLHSIDFRRVRGRPQGRRKPQGKIISPGAMHCRAPGRLTPCEHSKE